ncbi:hypothetical protein PG997_013334 [Apiospora hydei]|uniref:Uncharacterized protein n=1 Tax=Apiospora hydei TaxID=1337664 RepID=A0ABR1V5U7_9PEZI
MGEFAAVLTHAVGNAMIAACNPSTVPGIINNGYSNLKSHLPVQSGFAHLIRATNFPNHSTANGPPNTSPTTHPSKHITHAIMSQKALIDPGDLPLGTSAVTVLSFDFLEAIEQFKRTLPADYLRDSWFCALKKQCATAVSQPPSQDTSTAMMFLNGLYRLVCGDVAPESGWAKMTCMISTLCNGPEDDSFDGRQLFLKAANKENEIELLGTIAYGLNADEDSPTSITTAVRVAAQAGATVVKGEAADN